MKSNALVAGVIIALLNGLALAPAVSQYATYCVAGSLAFALWLVLKSALAPNAPQRTPREVDAPAPPAPPPPAPTKNVAEAEVLAVIGALQSKGRLVDFLMDDISKYSDAQVGAAARVVHQGCRAAFDEMFIVEPVSSEKEGSTITVPADAGEAYRVTGSVSGDGPRKGKLVHKGWKARSVNLPRVIKVDGPSRAPIAPAQVEVK
ncbi:DUF2760 domain-containing protein [Pelagicoccus sp. SDUM812003]|uniref:DUF2760 domain-containing protein n=1 Tax=Pelagicoccus sp. SDUM812003 TaxID=3041267 RepID=UPI00280FC7FD|nr:DUF2760 domain-containing protein [Pelagicoccus sp. SDUM812003]MDQ8204858.1 DUF2760 domain-containing protein [Pelagicoccus sp. SDUM812003]